MLNIEISIFTKILQIINGKRVETYSDSCENQINRVFVIFIDSCDFVTEFGLYFIYFTVISSIINYIPALKKPKYRYR